MKAVRMVAAYVLAVVVTAAVGSVVQTQYNLGALAVLGVPVSAEARLSTTLHDLEHFAPLYALVAGLALGLALPVAALLARSRARSRTVVHVLAGAAAIAVALGLMLLVMPVTPIGALRHASGFVLLVAGGAVGGMVYARVYRPSPGDTAAG